MNNFSTWFWFALVSAVSLTIPLTYFFYKQTQKACREITEKYPELHFTLGQLELVFITILYAVANLVLLGFAIVSMTSEPLASFFVLAVLCPFAYFVYHYAHVGVFLIEARLKNIFHQKKAKRPEKEMENDAI